MWVRVLRDRWGSLSFASVKSGRTATCNMGTNSVKYFTYLINGVAGPKRVIFRCFADAVATWQEDVRVHGWALQRVSGEGSLTGQGGAGAD